MAPSDFVLELFVQPGELLFAGAGTRLRTLLGSCVSITLWHPTHRIGAMCHCLLPNRGREARTGHPDGRYLDEAMVLLRRKLLATGTVAGEYEAKVFGGGHMLLQPDQGRRVLSVSDRNVRAALKLLHVNGFKLTACDVGGDGHRNVIFDVATGDVWVRRNQLSFADENRRPSHRKSVA